MKLLCTLGLLSLYFALILAQNNTSESPETTAAPGNNTDAPTSATSEKPAPASSTAGGMTTEAQATTAAPAPHDKDLYQVKEDGKVCILLKVKMNFSISYENNKNENVTKVFRLPDNETVTLSGSCGDNTQEITLEWNPEKDTTSEMKFIMNFKKDDKKEEYVDNILLHYKLADFLIPDVEKLANLTGQFFTVSETNQYLCKSNSTLKLDNNVSMLTLDMNLQAFRTDNSTDFTGDRQQCPADAETNNIVPIAVGAALAALVVIVLIAYLISRNRNKGGYESV